MEINSNLSVLEESIGYTFKDISLLELAVTHSSVAHERSINRSQYNERIEFLGDSVLELVSSEFLYLNFPEKKEGELTKLRASLVSEIPLAASAREIGLGDFLKLGVGEDKTGGRYRDSILSDAFEAVIGAIYMDGGLEPAKTFILKYVLTDIENKTLFSDSKSVLQEFTQDKLKSEVNYRIISETGPDHDKHFVAVACVGERVLGQGEGRSKKAAEQAAAYAALLDLKLK